MSTEDPRRLLPTLPTPLSVQLLTLAAVSLSFVVLGLAGPAIGVTLALAIGATLGFGGLGTLAARSVPPPAEARLGLRGFAPRLLPAIVLLLPLLIVASEIDNAVAEVFARPAELEAARQGQTDLDGLGWLEWTLFAALLAPVLEEFWFRGVVHQSLVAFGGVARGIAASAVLYAAARSLTGIGSAYAATSLVLQGLLAGIVLGWLRHYSGSLLPGILVSMGTAGLGVAATHLAGPLPIAGFNAEGAHSSPVLVALCALSVALGLVWAERVRIAPEVFPPVDPTSLLREGED